MPRSATNRGAENQVNARSRPSGRLKDLDEVAARVVEDGNGRRADGGRFGEEIDTRLSQPLVGGLHVLDLERGGGDALGEQRLLERLGGRVVAGLQVEEWIVRPSASERDLGDGRSVSLVADGWTLVQNTDLSDEDHPRLELFDHETDPLDLVNLATEHPDIVEHLTKEIDRWQRQAESAQLQSDEELGATLSADELKRLRSLEYVRWTARSSDSGTTGPFVPAAIAGGAVGLHAERLHAASTRTAGRPPRPEDPEDRVRSRRGQSLLA